MRFFATLTLLLLLSQGAHAKIHQTELMLDPIRALNTESVLVLDLDNTVMETPQMLGSAQWFNYLVKSYRGNGMPWKQAVRQAGSQWIMVQNVTDMRSVEKSTPEFIRGVQTMGIRVMALTTRPPALANRTIEQLAKIGIDFSRSPVSQKDVALEFKSGRALHTNGILFTTAGLKRGGVLAAFFEKAGYKPQRVVFVDDTLNNVQSVEQSMDKMKVAFEGFRYGAADARVKSFDAAVADTQFQYFGRILSDNAATQIRMAE